MTFDSITNQIQERQKSLQLAIDTMYQNILDIIDDEIAKNPDVWDIHAQELIYRFIEVYRRDPWNFVKEEIDPILDGTTLDPRKIKMLPLGSLQNIKNKILSFDDYE